MVDNDTKKSSTTIKKIYRSKPHVTMDNYFSGDRIWEWIGQKGLTQPRLAGETDFHQVSLPSIAISNEPISETYQVRLFFQLIVAVKNVEDTDDHCAYRKVNMSFQLSSSCNISTVNALSKCDLTVHKRERDVPWVQ